MTHVTLDDRAFISGDRIAAHSRRTFDGLSPVDGRLLTPWPVAATPIIFWCRPDELALMDALDVDRVLQCGHRMRWPPCDHSQRAAI